MVKNEEDAHSKRRQVMDIKNIKTQSSVLTNMSSLGEKKTKKTTRYLHRRKIVERRHHTQYTKMKKSMVFGPSTTKPCKKSLVAE